MREGGRGGRGQGQGGGLGMRGRPMYGGRGGQGPGGPGFMTDPNADFMLDPFLDPSLALDPTNLMAFMAGVSQGPGGHMGMPGMPGMGGIPPPMPPPMGGPRPPHMPQMPGMDAAGLSAALGPGPPDLMGLPMMGQGGGPQGMGLGMGFGAGMPGMPLMVGGPMGRGPAHNFGMGMLPGPAPPPGPPATGGPGGPGHYVPVGHSGGAGGGGKTQQQARQELLRQNNDYSQNFVDTGQRPQNYLRDSHLTDRYEEYPKLKQLIEAKDAQVQRFHTPPYSLKADLRSLKLSPETFGTKFDVILVDPPWEEYARRAPGLAGSNNLESWAWKDIVDLDVEAIAETHSFLFLWCGAEEGLEAGRVAMQKWGFRRCEDIVWIKTNRDASSRKYLQAANQLPESVLVHTKEHCLMGIRGTVRRATDGHLIHTNIDTDVIVSEEPALGSTAKPEELYAIIERFCNGRRRLELFGEDHNIRPGWVTVGKSLATSNFQPHVYASHFRNTDGSSYAPNAYGAKPPPGAPILVPSSEEIESLRPRSPPPSGGHRGGGGGGGGGHRDHRDRERDRE